MLNIVSLASTQWMIPLGLQLLPGVCVLAVLPFCPESPRFLAGNDKWEKAEANICKLRQLDCGHPWIINEIREIRAEVEFEAHLATINPGFWAKFKDLGKRGIRNRIGIGLCLMMCVDSFQHLPPKPRPLTASSTGVRT